MSVFRLILPLLALALSVCCSDGQAGMPSGFPKKIVPMTGAERSSTAFKHTAEGDFEAYTQQLEIKLQKGETLLQVINSNLDIDSDEEQIVIVKDTLQSDAPIKIIVADYDKSLRRYGRSWETVLSAVNERTFRLDEKDIIGDHTIQIVASGVNKQGAVTLDVFRPLSPSSARLSYFPVCRIESQGTIEIVETEREAGYSGGHRFGMSFPIHTYRTNPESEYYADIIREIYRYNYESGRYELGQKETIRAEKAGEAQLATLYETTSPEPFKNCIKGIWYKVDKTGESEGKILAFDPETEDIAFYTHGVEELYKWKYSRRSLYNTLHIYTENALLKSVQPNITVTLHSLDELSVSITEYSSMEQWLNDQWGGTYRRQTSAPLAAFPSVTPGFVSISKMELRGTFQSPDGIILEMSPPYFSWKEGRETRTGGYVVLEFHDDTVTRLALSLKIIEEQGLKITEQFYIITPAFTPAENASLSSFSLKPAATSVFGIEEAKGKILTFIRTGPN